MEDENVMALLASGKRLFESLMEQTADQIYIKDRTSRFIAASQALADMHGFDSRHDLEGLTDFDLFSEEHAQQAFDDEQEILRTETPLSKVEKETWVDGEDTWVSSTKAPLYLNSGKLVGIIGISRDVTPEIIAQRMLADSERRLREQNAIMRADYESARKVQSVMIPGRVPEPRHANLAYIWKPMTLVGGDIISFPRNPSKRLLFYLGDVCGHGVAAAFFTVLVKYLTAHRAETYADNPESFLNQVNVEITPRLNGGFITGLAGHFGARQGDGSRRLVISHAGHRQVVVYRKRTGTSEVIQLPGGTVMGIPGGNASQVEAIDMEIGDRFYAFTDGIIEASAPDGEEYGLTRLLDCFDEESNQPIKSTLDTVYAKVAAFTERPDQQDDITMVGIELA